MEIFTKKLILKHTFTISAEVYAPDFFGGALGCFGVGFFIYVAGGRSSDQLLEAHFSTQIFP